MKYGLTTILALLATPAFAEWQQVTDRATLRSEVVAQTWVDNSGNWFRLARTGTLQGGISDGRALTGSWRWTGGLVCFDREIGGEAFPSDCMVVAVDGNQMVVVRNNGTGSQRVYTRQ